MAKSLYKGLVAGIIAPLIITVAPGPMNSSLEGIVNKENKSGIENAISSASQYLNKINIQDLAYGGEKLINPYKQSFAYMHQIDPEAKIIRQKGEDLAKKGYYKAAIILYKKALETNQTNPLLYHQIGEFYEAQGQLHEAKKFYLKSFNLDNNFGYAIGSLGLLEYELGNLSLAKKYLRKTKNFNFDQGDRDKIDKVLNKN